MKKWKRNCPNPDHNPNCKKVITYSTKGNRDRAEKRNTNCKVCALTGRIFSNEHKKNISESLMGRKFTNKHKKNMGESKKGGSGYWKNKKRSEETKKKMKKNNSHHWRGIKRSKHSKRMIGKNNPMYGKSVYDIWLEKYGKEEADKREVERSKKQRLSRFKKY